MESTELAALLERTPVIAAVKNDDQLQRCLACESGIVFILYGSVTTIPRIAKTAREAGKTVFVHVDLLDGLAAREAAVDYIAQSTCAHGVISTRPGLIRHAHAVGLSTVQRYFVLDSMALENVLRPDAHPGADLIEILPGLMPKIIRRLCAQLDRPLIAGGLISDKDDVMAALAAGAVAVSSTNEDVWFL